LRKGFVRLIIHYNDMFLKIIGILL
jgi:hypothetical protein